MREALRGWRGVRLSRYMTPMTLARSGLCARLADAGYALLPAAGACATLQLDLAGLEALRDSWERLPRDAHLRDGGNYRARRHSCFEIGRAACRERVEVPVVAVSLK